MSSQSKVCFFFDSKNFTLGNRTALKDFIVSIFKREKCGLDSISYVFCSDKKLLKINKEFLHHDYYTDIISFDLSDSDRVNAEIYISIDRVKENAGLLNISFKSELHRVIFHGALHLCGYKDMTLREKETMRKVEDHYLSLYFRT